MWSSIYFPVVFGSITFHTHDIAGGLLPFLLNFCRSAWRILSARLSASDACVTRPGRPGKRAISSAMICGKHSFTVLRSVFLRSLCRVAA